MVWALETKGYHIDDSKNFTGIIPIWSGYSKYYYLRPINHIKITGIAVRIEDFDKSDRIWHPDNVYSEKYVEVVLKWCRWEWNDRGEYTIKECRDLTYPNFLRSCNNSQLWKFYVQATQMQLIARDITYKSKDREQEEAEYYQDAWNCRHVSLAE